MIPLVIREATRGIDALRERSLLLPHEEESGCLQAQ